MTVPQPLSLPCLCCVVLCVTLGCGGATKRGDTAGGASADGLTAEDIASRMTAAYRQAETYVDNAQYHEKFTLREDGVEYDVPSHVVSCVFARPNRIRINREVPAVGSIGLSATLASNGEVVRAFVSDHVGQVLEFPAPNVLTTEKLFASEPLRETILPVPLENLYPQIDLLLSSEESPPRLLAGGKLKRLEDKALDGSQCLRLQLVRPKEGARVLWIDAESFLLRRMEMPTANVRNVMDAGGALSDLELWIDFRDAAVGIDVDAETFEMEVPQEALRVRDLVTPPRPLPSWLGQEPEGYAFEPFDGDAVTADSLAGKVVVLDFWFTGCGPCQQSMPALEKLYQAYRDNDQFQFFAVSVDPPQVPDKSLISTLEKWGGSMPVLRDPDNHGEKQFGVTGWPTTILLGPSGKIQQVSRGAKTNYDDWRETIDKLLAGGDVANDLLTQHRDAMKAYEAAVAAVTISNDEASSTSVNDDPPTTESEEQTEN